jgi:hypothetical protein
MRAHAELLWVDDAARVGKPAPCNSLRICCTALVLAAVLRSPRPAAWVRARPPVQSLPSGATAVASIAARRRGRSGQRLISHLSTHGGLLDGRGTPCLPGSGYFEMRARYELQVAHEPLTPPPPIEESEPSLLKGPRPRNALRYVPSRRHDA